MDKDPLKKISDEIKRQYHVIIKVDESHDIKIGVFLGFAILVYLELVIRGDISSLFLRTNLSSSFFIMGSIVVFISILFAFKGYFTRKYFLGPDINELMKLYRDGYNEIEQKIDRTIYEANEKNADIGKQKAGCIKIMISLFVLGFVLILLSIITSNIGLEVIRYG